MRRIDRSKDDHNIQKWLPIVEQKFRFRNHTTNCLICLYCEWYASDLIESTSNDLADRLIEIRGKVESYDRIEIIGQFFNPASGLIEYKLENGDFISTDGRKTENELTDKEKIKIFGIEFIRDLDPQEFRIKQLDKIL